LSSTPDERSSSDDRHRPDSGTELSTGFADAAAGHADGMSTTDHGPRITDLPKSTSQPPASRKRRNRRGTERGQQIGNPSGGDMEPAQPGESAGDRLDTRPAAPAAAQPAREHMPATPRRAEPGKGGERGTNPASRPRRTEGTRPPDQGNGRGLAGSPRNPNAFGEIPIRPDNRTFDGLHDRLVCIARSHVIPEDFPVHYRPATASARLGVVASSGYDLLLCDLSHGGPHVWPDQTVVPVGPEPDPGDRPDRNASIA